MTGPSEESANSSEGWVREAQLAGGTGIFRLDLRSSRWDWTPQIAVLFGFDADKASYQFEDWDSAIFADDVPKLRAAITTAISGGAFYVELRVRHADGSVHWLAGKGHVKIDDRGEARWLFGSFFEITDRKLFEVRLLAVNEM